jgi:hypothetical protein
VSFRTRIGQLADIYARGNLKKLPAVLAAPALPLEIRMKWGLVLRPQYAWGIRRAAEQAKGLGYAGMTVVEFGVAEGAGLRLLDQYAGVLGASLGLEVRVVGFDAGAGLPKPDDFRDCPWQWEEGWFPMSDPDGLRADLSANAELVIGDVADTVPAYVARAADALRAAPVGFVSFDLDFYSSTMSAFRLFDAGEAGLLPRVTCYMDDLSGITPFVGELTAMTEWNDAQPNRKIGRVNMLRDTLPFNPAWAEKIYEMHSFDHEKYRVSLRGDQDPLMPGPTFSNFLR